MTQQGRESEFNHIDLCNILPSYLINEVEEGKNTNEIKFNEQSKKIDSVSLFI